MTFYRAPLPLSVVRARIAANSPAWTQVCYWNAHALRDEAEVQWKPFPSTVWRSGPFTYKARMQFRARVKQEV